MAGQSAALLAALEAVALRPPRPPTRSGLRPRAWRAQRRRRGPHPRAGEDIDTRAGRLGEVATATGVRFRTSRPRRTRASRRSAVGATAHQVHAQTRAVEDAAASAASAWSNRGCLRAQDRRACGRGARDHRRLTETSDVFAARATSRPRARTAAGRSTKRAPRCACAARSSQHVTVAREALGGTERHLAGQNAALLAALESARRTRPPPPGAQGAGPERGERQRRGRRPIRALGEDLDTRAGRSARSPMRRARGSKPPRRGRQRARCRDGRRQPARRSGRCRARQDRRGGRAARGAGPVARVQRRRDRSAARGIEHRHAPPPARGARSRHEGQRVARRDRRSAAEALGRPRDRRRRRDRAHRLGRRGGGRAHRRCQQPGQRRRPPHGDGQFRPAPQRGGARCRGGYVQPRAGRRDPAAPRGRGQVADQGVGRMSAVDQSLAEQERRLGETLGASARARTLRASTEPAGSAAARYSGRVGETGAVFERQVRRRTAASSSALGAAIAQHSRRSRGGERGSASSTTSRRPWRAQRRGHRRSAGGDAGIAAIGETFVRQASAVRGVCCRALAARGIRSLAGARPHRSPRARAA